MNELAVILGWVGIYGVMALGAIGSIIGCAVAGQAADRAAQQVPRLHLRVFIDIGGEQGVGT